MKRPFRIVLLATVLAMISTAPAGAVTAPGGSFIDDDANIHEPAIEAIRTAGITTGCDPVGDVYCPGAAVTRAEMAAFLVRALGEGQPTPSATGNFTDVAGSAWYAPFVDRLVELDITTGYTDGTYRPDQPVTRAEMAAFVIRALDESASVSGSRFDDIDGDAWYAGLVERLAELDITAGCEVSPLRYCPADSVLRDQMASFVARAFDLALEDVPARPSVQSLTLSKVDVASGFSSPIFLDAPVGDDRLFVVEQGGRIKVVDDGSTSTFLDISSKVRAGGEQGLLGLAFHPEFSSNGLFYVHYTRGDGSGVISEFSVNGEPNVADGGSERILKVVGQPANNHNGGMLAFGPDGFLYAGFGDGGGGGDTFGQGQRTDTILGSIARLDPATGGPAPGNPFGNEVYYPGIRNPWRFSIDGARMYIGDVGQDRLEEIDVVSLFAGGTNFGWPITEGSECWGAATTCDRSGLTGPVAEYGRSIGRSITGGYVYRGSAIPSLSGHYLYGDFVTGFVGSFRYDGSGTTDSKTWASLATSGLASFGTDGAGEMYIVSLGGTISKIVAG